MGKKRLPNIPFMAATIIISFCLAVFDMFFLRNVFYGIFGDMITASVIAFALAFTADVSALLWGRQKGLRDNSWKSFKWGWIALGFVYMLIRGASFYSEVIAVEDYEFETIMNQVVPIIVLTISYVGTGTLLQWAGSSVWDQDIVDYKDAKKKFEAAHAKVIKNRAAILDMVERLDEYDKNYESLDRQYKIHKDKIRKTEYSTMSLITAKTIANNPEISPSEAKKVMSQVLEERDRENERAHSR